MQIHGAFELVLYKVCSLGQRSALTRTGSLPAALLLRLTLLRWAALHLCHVERCVCWACPQVLCSVPLTSASVPAGTTCLGVVAVALELGTLFLPLNSSASKLLFAIFVPLLFLVNFKMTVSACGTVIRIMSGLCISLGRTQRSPWTWYVSLHVVTSALISVVRFCSFQHIVRHIFVRATSFHVWVIVSGVVVLTLVSTCSLLIQRKAVALHIFILHPVTLLNSHICSNSTMLVYFFIYLFCIFLVFSYRENFTLCR